MPETSPIGILLPVSLYWGSQRAAVSGRLTEVTDGYAEVELTHDPPAGLVEGLGVSIRPEGKRNLELIGIVRHVLGTHIAVEIRRTGHREDRWSPREKGRLRFRYLSPPEGFDVRSWAVEEQPNSPSGAWVEPDPRVEISLGGLGFLVKEHLSGHLLIECIHPATGEPFRVSARVIRQTPTLHEGIFHVGVMFDAVSPRSGSALAEILTALQDAAIEGFSDSSTLDLPEIPMDVAKTNE